MSEYKSFKEGWKEHNNKNLHMKLDKCKIIITKQLHRIKKLNEELKNKRIGYKGLVSRNMDLQNRLFYEERVNTELKREIKRLKRTSTEITNGLKYSGLNPTLWYLKP